MIGLDPNDSRVHSAARAELIADFWRSEIGQYLKAKADKEIEDNTRILVEQASEMDKETLMATQAKIWRASMFCEWLQEAYEQGCADLHILEEETDAERTV
jgi:hypothetical protein